MSQKISHTKETQKKGAMYSRKSRCQVKNSNDCIVLKSCFDRKNPLRSGKKPTLIRKLLLKLGAARLGCLYQIKNNCRKIIRLGVLGDRKLPETRRGSVIFGVFTCLSL
jgi:hypothetical protein